MGASSEPASGDQVVLALSPDDIEVGERIGLFWPEKAEAFGARIRVDGQNDPIKVRRNGNRAEKPWRLVAGLHRLEGIRGERLPIVFAIEVFGDEHQLRAIEASENMDRRDFGPIERAMHIRAIASVHEAQFGEGFDGLSPQQVGMRRRWAAARDSVAVRDDEKAELEALNSEAVAAGLYGWQENAAAAAGLKARSLRNYLLIYRTIVDPLPTLAAQLARTRLGGNLDALLTLAKTVDFETRAKLIEAIVADPEIKSVDEARVLVGLAESKGKRDQAVGQTEYMNRAGTNLERLSSSGWREFAKPLAEKIKPSALVAVRDALNARIAELGVDSLEVGDE